MSTYEDEHNINAPTSTRPHRTHQTLSSVIDSFLTSTTIPDINEIAQALQSMEGSIASQLVETLQNEKKQGLDDSYLDNLERVNVKDLGDDDCPICTNKFQDDKYPLVVKLPCGLKKGHIFDLDCIGPWLKMNSTCPLCRFDLLDIEKQRKERLDKELKELRDEDSEEEEEDWDVYG